MILKIQVPEVRNKWVFYDHVEQITVSKGLWAKEKFNKEWEKDDSHLHVNAVYIDEKLIADVSLVCFVKRGLSVVEERAVWFNTEAYLLNDEGKTIERL